MNMSKQKFFAHSQNSAGEMHLLREHLFGVQKHVKNFKLNTTQKNLAILAALLHDLGKYLIAFQNYLLNGGRRGSLPHAKWGAILARCLDREEVSFAIDGHHAGLPNYSTWSVEHTAIDEEIKQELAKLFSLFIEDTGISEKELLALTKIQSGAPREKDILTRFIFSCLVDADWLDTEEHFAPDKTTLRTRHSLDIDDTITRLEANFAKLSAEPKPINKLRTQARLSALEKAHLPVGFFSLNLPTGLGKTLTSFRWALEHAKANSLERIIIVLPYTNIIDQTATSLKNILGKDSILEHHSSYLPDDSEEENIKKLACENWNYPVIVTTSVQFFETLFASSRGKCRKLHNIANSVVILDEVQTLNKDLVLATLDMLQDVQKSMNTSFVFCTATMPAFEKREKFEGIKHITPLVNNAEELFMHTQRVTFTLLQELNPLSFQDLSDRINAATSSTLTIVNTKQAARDLFMQAKKSGNWDKVYHLSTNMCPHHRKQCIEKITQGLKQKQKKILLVATQLVEAGVDLDFPCVFRELAPLESIIQAAGRCNRDGLLPEKGQVYLFQLEDAHYPDRFYQTQTQHLRSLLLSEAHNLYSYPFFAEYYKQILNLFVVSKPISSEREKLNFATVNDMYRLISSNTRALFIFNYSEESLKIGQSIQKKLKIGIPLSQSDYQSMQPYCVQVYENFLHQYCGLWEEDQNYGLLFWNAGYSKEIGLDAEALDNLIL